MHTCNKCSVELTDQNWLASWRKIGSYTCKACTNERVKKWQKDNPEKYLLNRAKERARAEGLPFDLTWEDITIPEFCPALGIRLSKSTTGRPDSCSPSLDKLIPAKGYVRGNVAVISYRANVIKQNATAQELEAVATWVRSMT